MKPIFKTEMLKRKLYSKVKLFNVIPTAKTGFYVCREIQGKARLKATLQPPLYTAVHTQSLPSAYKCKIYVHTLSQFTRHDANERLFQQQFLN